MDFGTARHMPMNTAGESRISISSGKISSEERAVLTRLEESFADS